MTMHAMTWTQAPMLAPLQALAHEAGWLAPPLLPAVEQLNRLAAACGARSGGGRPLRFEMQPAAAAPAAANYELRIHDEGVVPLRAASRHDAFNALAWLAFPRTKAALNRAHVEDLRAQAAAARSARRDALTLLDESGVLVLSSDNAVLERIRAFEWQRVLWVERATLRRTTQLLLFGHGLCEKALAPYVGMTGHALLLAAPATLAGAEDATLVRAAADELAAQAVAATLAAPRDLAPLPVLGVPGWWPANGEATFYDNREYFRPGRVRDRRRAG
jgi:hypothetical protein